MTVEIELRRSLVECPAYWQKFIKELQETTNCKHMDVPYTILQSALKKHNARYRLAGSRKFDHIEFENEEDLLMFTLKWS